MAVTNHSTEPKSLPPTPQWPNEPEDLLRFIPDDLEGSPFEMLLCTILRAHGIVSLLSADFMGEGDFRPDDQVIVSALWTAQSHLHLARELLEHLDFNENNPEAEGSKLAES